MNLKNIWAEPVAFWAAVQTVVVAAISFGWLSDIGLEGKDDTALAVGVISALAAVHLALFTHRTLLAPLVQVIQAFASFLVIYGVHVDPEAIAGIVAGITAVAAAWHRNSVTPLEKGSFALVA